MGKNKNKALQTKNKSLIKKIRNIPLFISTYIILTIFLYFLNIFFKEIAKILGNDPNKIIHEYQIWRLITSSFITTNIYKIILGFFCLIKFGASFERNLGTTKYMIIFIINSFFIQILFCFIQLLILLIPNKELKMIILNNENNNSENNGMWGIIFCELTLIYLNKPQAKFHFLFFHLKMKYYYLLLCLLLSLLDSFKIDCQILSGIIYGIIYFYVIKARLQIPDSFINNIENKYCFKFLTKLKRFKKNKGNVTGNVIISNNENSYSPVQITTSSSLNNNINAVPLEEEII